MNLHNLCYRCRAWKRVGFSYCENCAEQIRLEQFEANGGSIFRGYSDIIKPSTVERVVERVSLFRSWLRELKHG